MKYSMYYKNTQEKTNVIKALPIDDYKLRLYFSNGEVKVYDIKPLLKKKSFEILKDKTRFSKVKINDRAIVWNFTGNELDDIDICPENLYWDSVPETN